MTVTADGTESKALLPSMTPGATYQVTVIAVKGLEESDPGTDTVTTGKQDGLHFYHLEMHVNNANRTTKRDHLCEIPG